MPLNLKPEHEAEWFAHFDLRLDRYARCTQAVVQRLALPISEAKVAHDIVSELMWQSDDYIRSTYKDVYHESDRTLLTEDEIKELVVDIVKGE
jgi:hypothetical protein